MKKNLEKQYINDLSAGRQLRHVKEDRIFKVVMITQLIIKLQSQKGGTLHIIPLKNFNPGDWEPVPDTQS
jgi:hypothetical protein